MVNGTAKGHSDLSNSMVVLAHAAVLKIYFLHESTHSDLNLLCNEGDQFGSNSRCKTAKQQLSCDIMQWESVTLHYLSEFGLNFLSKLMAEFKMVDGSHHR